MEVRGFVSRLSGKEHYTKDVPGLVNLSLLHWQETVPATPSEHFVARVSCEELHRVEVRGALVQICH